MAFRRRYASIGLGAPQVSMAGAVGGRRRGKAGLPDVSVLSVLTLRGLCAPGLPGVSALSVFSRQPPGVSRQRLRAGVGTPQPPIPPPLRGSMGFVIACRRRGADHGKARKGAIYCPHVMRTRTHARPPFPFLSPPAFFPTHATLSNARTASPGSPPGRPDRQP